MANVIGSQQTIERGSKRFNQVTFALFMAGLATFALLYCVQPIMPLLSQHYQVSASSSSLSLSCSTALLAIGLLITGPLSDAYGRKSVMNYSLLLATLCSFASVVSQHWHTFLFWRALLGLSLSGIAAVAMSYLSEEIHPSAAAFAMGLYISGNSIGGMAGRLVTGVITDYYPWHIALTAISLLALLAAVLFYFLLPASKHFHAHPWRLRKIILFLFLHWRDRRLPWLFFIAFLLMGSFVTLFNYISYRLLAAPYGLSQASIGLLSLSYLTGTFSSPRAGILSQRYGKGRVLASSMIIMLIGLWLTACSALLLIFIGMLCFTAGFFAAHATASSYVTSQAKRGKGQAASFYLFFYYLGSSLVGTAGGLFWHHWQWPGIVAFLTLLLVAGLLLAYYTLLPNKKPVLHH